MIVIGTAGHIDHGKSSIVKRLTGTDPDRLPEEKKRGMTIDLGFAFYQTPENDTIAFVDVPGHERFVKNMIAGAGGIDSVMLVVAADDGWMPQTEEHFQIVRLLGVQHGLIVINKADLVDDNAIEKLKAAITDKTQKTFLSNAPIIAVSSTTGDGFDKLAQYLNTITNDVTARRDIDKARLYVDRVFIRQGIGTVVTGTLRDGKLNVGQTVTIWPSLKQSKIKTLQSNNQNVETALPAQRTAVSLTGVNKDDLIRGGVITVQSDLYSLKNKPVLAAEIELLKNSPVTIANRRKVSLLIGTTETEAEIRLPDKQEILPGNKCILFLKCEEPVYAMVGDHIIVRLPTPMVTIGGGVVLDNMTKLPKFSELERMNYLNSRDVHNLENLVGNELDKCVAVKKNDILRQSNYSDDEIAQTVDKLVKSGLCGNVGNFVVSNNAAEEISNQILTRMAKSSVDRKTNQGWSVDEFKSDIRISADRLDVIFSILLREKKLEYHDDRYFLMGEKSKVSPEVEQAYESILEKLNKDRYTPPALAALTSNGKSSKEAIGLLIKHNKVHKCGSEFLFAQDVWDEIENFIKNKLSKQDELKVGELRDKFAFSRKYAVPILEETDKLKITARKGDVRIKGEAFES